MITEGRIHELIDEKLAESEYFLVDLSIQPGNKIKVEIDGPNGFPISECVNFSRQIEHNLDREAEDFELEVSSPGLTKPFKVHGQYLKNIGRQVKIKTLDNEKCAGKLTRADENGITLVSEEKKRMEGRKKKEIIRTELEFEYSNIKEAKLVLEF